MNNKYIDVRQKLIEMDLRLARTYCGSESIRELLDRMATTIEELQAENKLLWENYHATDSNVCKK